MGKIFSELGQEVIFQLKKGQPTPEYSKPVVYDPVKQVFGILTGEISIKFNGQVSAGTLAEEYELKEVQTFEHLQIGIFKATSAEAKDLTILAEQLRKDIRVTRVTLEILDQQVKPQ